MNLYQQLLFSELRYVGTRTIALRENWILHYRTMPIAKDPELPLQIGRMNGLWKPGHIRMAPQPRDTSRTAVTAGTSQRDFTRPAAITDGFNDAISVPMKDSLSESWFASNGASEEALWKKSRPYELSRDSWCWIALLLIRRERMNRTARGKWCSFRSRRTGRPSRKLCVRDTSRRFPHRVETYSI